MDKGIMIAVVDAGAGNLASVKRALDKIGQESVITCELFDVYSADRIILPGVGTADYVMNNLRESGLDRALTYKYCEGTPILGICIGMHVVMESSDEGESTDCLGWVDGTVGVLDAKRIPHVGWNTVDVTQGHPVFEGITDKDFFYFVHSFRVLPKSDIDVLCYTWYDGRPFVSTIAKSSLIAAQFHVEKSGAAGLNILRNFCAWNPRKALS